jgi:subtilisin-like proprotein convertase family protein
MSRSIRHLALLLLCATAVLAFGGHRAPVATQQIPTEVVSARLVRALEGEGPWNVWVFFRDKGLEEDALTAALSAAEAGLDPRSLRRRAKVFAAGGPLVDAADLPLHPLYLDRAVATGAEPRQESRWLNAASFRATAAQVKMVAGLDCVKAVDLVGRFTRAAVPTPAGAPVPVSPAAGKAATDIDYGGNLGAMLQANVPPLHDMGLTGTGVVVGVLDTGFRTTHEAVDHIPVRGAWDFVNGDGVVDNEAGDPTNARSHGTMVLSTLAGNMPGRLVAPAFGVAVILGKTEDVAVEVPLEEDFWVAGLEYAEGLGADIVSSSLGYIDWYAYEDLDGGTAVTTIAADLAVGRGVVVVNSAGNERNASGSLVTPADGDSVIAVGAVASDDQVTYFSSPGPTADGRIKPDVAAMGIGNTVADPNDDSGYFQVAGTSFSCPLTAGVVALMLERVPGLTPMQVIEALRATASQAGSPDNDLGWGIIDAYAAAHWFGPVFTHQALGNTQDTAGPYTVMAGISDRVGLNPASARLFWRVGAGPWNELPLAASGGPATFGANIPGQPSGSTVEYYLQASGTNGLTTTHPATGASSPLAFLVGDWLDIGYAADPAAPIPDGPGWGAVSTIEVPVVPSGTIVAVDVDIQVTHPDAGELMVALTAPDGSAVTLHDHTAAGTAGLIGNWESTLAVDGPGSLADLVGSTNKGTWTLTVVDNIPGNTGTLDSWGLNFTLTHYPTDVPAATTPQGNVLGPNVPNPFNPLTRISFDLARGGKTRLSIFDLRGMLVRNLIDADLPAGPRTVAWDGRDDAGVQVGSGAYLYRLESGGQIQARKMLLLR